MSFFSRVWTGEYGGHTLVVRQKMGSHRYVLEIDGRLADEYTSAVNFGPRNLRAKLLHEGRELEVEVVARQGFFTESATLTVGGEAVPLKKS